MSDWLGSLIGAVGNVAGGLASNSLSSFQMKEMARMQAALNYKYAKKSALEMPGYSRQGLENANLNPMLALGNVSGAQSSWSTSIANPTTPDLSSIGSNAVSNALAVKQQNNQDRLTIAQEQNYNADSVLKNNQSITQMYEQLEKLNHADLMRAQKQLTDKNVSWYDKQQAREDLRVANEIERTGNDFKVGMAQAIASQISANANQITAIANSKDVEYRNTNTKEANDIARAGIPPKWVTAVGAGLGAGLGMYGAVRSLGSKSGTVRSKPYATSVPYTHR